MNSHPNEKTCDTNKVSPSCFLELFLGTSQLTARVKRKSELIEGRMRGGAGGGNERIIIYINIKKSCSRIKWDRFPDVSRFARSSDPTSSKCAQLLTRSQAKASCVKLTPLTERASDINHI